MVFIDNLGIGARQIHFKSPLSDYLDWGRAYLHSTHHGHSGHYEAEGQKISVLPRTFYNLIRLVSVYDPKTHIKHNITQNHGQSDGGVWPVLCTLCTSRCFLSLTINTQRNFQLFS